jgi:hypothetical protein
MAEASSLSLRVGYTDSDLIELEATVSNSAWSGFATAYTTQDQLKSAADRLEDWVSRPHNDSVVEAGTEAGGWIRLRFYEIDRAGHLVCHIQIAANSHTDGRPEEVWRLSLEMRTECWLIIRFAQQLRAKSETLVGEAMLAGV